MITCILIWCLSTKLYLPVWALSSSPGLELEIKLVGNLCSFESEYWIWNIERMWPPASSIHNPSLHSQQTLKFAYLQKCGRARARENHLLIFVLEHTVRINVHNWGLTVLKSDLNNPEMLLEHWAWFMSLEKNSSAIAFCSFNVSNIWIKCTEKLHIL